MRYFRRLLAGLVFAGSLCLAAMAQDDVVIYGVVPTLFSAENPLEGVCQALPKIKELGVTHLWISPIMPSDDPSHISYAITDYRKIRPDFGTAEDLRKLVTEAHALGLKVILDFVPNHTSDRHGWFLDAKENGETSAFFRFYTRDKEGKPSFYFDWSHLPNLDYSREEVVTAMSEAMVYWLKEFDIDGFRMDAAWGLRERSPEAWPRLIAALREAKPGCFLLAEAGPRDPYYADSGFNAVYDWSDRPGEWAWEKPFRKNERLGKRLLHIVATSLATPASVLRFINNNDTGERFVTKYGAAKTKLAAVIQFTVPGIPLIYTGDETGEEYDPYEDAPPLAWRDPHHLREFYRRLIALRRSLPALQSGTWTPLATSGGPETCAYVRSTKENEWALVVVNFGPAADFSIRVPEFLREPLLKGKFREALHGQTIKPVQNSEGLLLQMEAESALILVSEPAQP